MPIVTGKRKRPTGEATFDVPDSPAIEISAYAGDGQHSRKPRGEERGDGGAHEGNNEEEGEPDGILGPMETNRGAFQRGAVKKRKKRKSIGQQAPKRAKAKVSPVQKLPITEVKPEPMSPSAQLEGSSRLDAVPTEDEDPVETQLRQELAGAAEEGLRDSLVGDFEDEVPRKVRKGIQKSQQQDGEIAAATAGEGIDGEGEMAIDPLLYSLPLSTSSAKHLGPTEDDEIGEEDAQGKDDEEEYQDVEENQQAERQAPKAQMLSIPAKSKRKKRKSIGQQKIKRPSTGKPAKPSTVATQKAASNLPAKISKPKSTQQRSTALKSNAGKPRAPPTNTVPITIYRPAPQSHKQGQDGQEAGEDEESDPDPLTAPLPPPTKTITSIDVLSQVTRELVAKPASNANLSTRAQTTIEMYGRELEARMKQLGQALATNGPLGKRVRAVNGEDRR